MSDDTTKETDQASDEHSIVQPVGDPHSTSDAQIEAYDLDGDGKISLLENERARLGIVDARLEELAEEDGIKGRLAEVAHKIIDKIDNDEST